MKRLSKSLLIAILSMSCLAGCDTEDIPDVVSIEKIEKTNTEGLVDTYTITLTNGETQTFTVTNGSVGGVGDKGDDGVGIDTISKVSSEGLVDTYKIILTNGSDFTFTINNGSNGANAKTLYTNFIEPNTLVDISYSPRKASFEVGENITFEFKVKDEYFETYEISSVELNDQIISLSELETNNDSYAYTTKMVENGFYVKANTGKTEIKLNKNSVITFDENAYGYIETNNNVISFSKAVEDDNNLVKMNRTGIVFNQNPLGKIKNISIEFDNDSFETADLYYGNYLFSTDNIVELTSSNSINIGEDASFFVIHNTSENIIKSINVLYSTVVCYEEQNIPTVNIVTGEDGQGAHLPINSRVDYTSAMVEILDEDGKADVKSSKAGIRIRGNSTANCPKKPYRIKFDKKQSVFGSTKAKNWALLADYMDASSMHNYMALTFAQMVRDESEFCCSCKHVNVFINGEYNGLYLLTEQVDEKEGRVNIEQEDGYFLSLFNDQNELDFDSTCFMIERDLSATTDNKEVLDETYFKITLSDESSYYYSLKYPEKENFYSNPDDESTFDSDKYFIFFNNIKDYITDIHEKFLLLNDSTNSSYDNLNEIVDYDSLASYALVDLFMYESDHASKSFKLYKRPNEKLKFGPCWDYDSVCMRLPFTGEPVDNPLESYNKFNANIKGYLWCGEIFSRLFYQNTNGKNLIKSIYHNKTFALSSAFANSIISEIKKINYFIKDDCVIWYKNNFSMVFENILFVRMYLADRLNCLNSFLA